MGDGGVQMLVADKSAKREEWQWEGLSVALKN